MNAGQKTRDLWSANDTVSGGADGGDSLSGKRRGVARQRTLDNSSMRCQKAMPSWKSFSMLLSAIWRLDRMSFAQRPKACKRPTR